MVSEMFRKAVRLSREWCPDTVGMLSETRRNSRFKEWSDAGKPARVRLDSAVRMNRWNREMETLMAQKRLTMRQIHEILRLKYQNQLSVREIARSCGLAVSTVGDYVQRAAAAGLAWPLPEGLTEEALTKQLFGHSDSLEAPPPGQPLPDWSYIHKELRRKSVTLQLLWEEYRQIHPQEATVPDNPKTAVIKPCRYEPQLHCTYQDLGTHYQTAIIPARPRKPRDKAKVETAVQIAERHILAALRDQRFFSVGELNQAIPPLLLKLNDKPFQKLEGSRNSWFEAHEKAKLLPLPATPFELATWSFGKVNIDYHVMVENHGYSVPYTLVHEQVDVRLTDKTVELFKAGKRVAAHVRSYQSGLFTTLEEHRPKSHQKYLEWTPGRMIEWATKIGPECGKVVEKILQDRPHPEMGFRSCLGIIRLGKAVGHARLEAACRRALHFGTCSYTSINSILQKKLEAQPLEQELPLPSPTHENLRGGPYYR